jgi:hypothetical protein
MKRLIVALTLLVAASAQVAMTQTDPHPSVRLAWNWAQGTGDMATGFHVQRAATSGGPYTVVGTVPVATLTYLDTTVVAGSTWYYVVTAYNTGGESGPSGEVKCTLPFLAPTTPSGLSGSVK